MGGGGTVVTRTVLHASLAHDLIHRFIEEAEVPLLVISCRHVYIADSRYLGSRINLVECSATRERNTYGTHKNLVTLIEIEVSIRVESLASVFPNQSDHVMAEHIERETLSEISLEVRLEKVVPLFEEIPGMVKLDASQLGEFVFLILRAECVVDSGYCEDGSCANGAVDKLFVLTDDGIDDGGVESVHKVRRGDRIRGGGAYFNPRGLGDYIPCTLWRVTSPAAAFD